MKKEKIILAGGTGFVGETLTQYFISRGKQVVVLTRGATHTKGTTLYLHWDGKSTAGWLPELENALAIINLSGKSVNCRYTEANKREILDSRIQTTQAIGAAIGGCQHPPKVWINASAVTIYPSSETKTMDEYQEEFADDFTATVSRQWEKAFKDSATVSTRQAVVRIGMVLGKNGGAMPPLVRLVRLGMGGKQACGKQMISWIHELDLARMMEWIINNEYATGAYNGCAPYPISNETFMHVLRKVYGCRIGIPQPEFLLKIGAWLIGTEAELLLKSSCVLPTKLLEEGFVFSYPHLREAVEEISMRA